MSGAHAGLGRHPRYLASIAGSMARVFDHYDNAAIWITDVWRSQWFSLVLRNRYRKKDMRPEKR